MKICLLTAPALVWSQDDTSTLLSMKMQMHSTMAAGVDQLLESVGSRNVTQMSSLIQDLVEETISEEGPYVGLDGDVQGALEMIKNVLLSDIRGALKEAHCQDQVELHEGILCFERCEDEKQQGADSCVQICDGSAHKDCRDNLLELYKMHVLKCQALDDWVKSFTENECPKFDKKCCLLDHTTWNCGHFTCNSQIANIGVNDETGRWLNEQVGKFQSAYASWQDLHQKCADSYKDYVEVDAECDCKQAECETTNCEYESCHYLNCEDTYNKCWGRCEADYVRTEETKECLEKDRKIDWSATEKIECFVNVLLEKPDNATLLKECGTDNCYNEYRKKMYHKCNDICQDVDFDGDWGEHQRRDENEGHHSGRSTRVKDQTTHQHADQDVTHEGKHSVLTRHRGGGDDKRCTSHLDLDYQKFPCCHPCEERPSPPCEGKGDYEDQTSYMWIHYNQHRHFLDEDIEGLEAKECKGNDHTYSYAYNLCQCIDCPGDRPPIDPICTDAKACVGGPYDYRKHDIKVTCSGPAEGPSDVDEE